MCSHKLFTRSLSLLTGLGIGSLMVVDVAIAATFAFQEQLTQDQLTQTWQSPFKGQVVISGDLLGGTVQDLDVELLVDGVDVLTQQSDDVDASAGYSLNVDVEKDALVEFRAKPLTNSPFEFETQVSIEAPSLVFIEPTGDSIGQVALFYDDLIYESHPAYTNDPYEDIFTGIDQNIADDNGVQKSHTLGTYLGLTEDTDNRQLPWDSAELVPIPEEDADALVTWLETQMGRNYIPTFVTDFTTSVKQKGIDGGRYSEVGLIERAAEKAGINNGQGYIPNALEFVAVNAVIAGNSDFGCTVVGCSQPINQTHYLSVLSPALLYKGVVEGFDLSDWLHGWLEETDFTLTGPGGVLTYEDGKVIENSLGALVSTGTFDADAGVGNAGGKSCDNPPDPINPVPKKDLQFVQFLLEDRQSGPYRFELTGISSLSRVIIGDEDDGVVVGIGDCGVVDDPIVFPRSPEPPPPEKVPEPSAVLGLLVLGSVGFWHRHHRHYSE